MTKINFPSVIPDNESQYLDLLQAVILSVDEYSSSSVTKSSEGYIFRISPSLPIYSQTLLREIIELHKVLQIHLDFSKSIRTNSTICFKIQVVR